MESLFPVIAIVVLIIVTLKLGVRTVPQGRKDVVQRLGKYHKTLTPGLNFIFPYIDAVAYKVTTKDIVLDVGFGFAKTLDENYFVLKNLEAFKMFNLPLLVGISRKSMLYKTLNIKTDYTTEQLISITERLISNSNKMHRSLGFADSVKVEIPYTQKEIFNKFSEREN